MRLIAITAEDYVEGEAKAIEHLLDNGFAFVHLRKPHGSDQQMLALVRSIHSRYHSRLTLASNLGVWGECALGGVHLNAANEHRVGEFDGVRVSKSSHCEADLTDLSRFDYSFLSPVFDSISKPGYRAAFSHDQLRAILSNPVMRQKLVALGGVTPARIPILASLGFQSAALLGYLNPNSNSDSDSDPNSD